MKAEKKARLVAEAIKTSIRQLREAGKLPRGGVIGWAKHSRIAAGIRFEALDRKTDKRCRVPGGVEKVLADMFKGLEEAGVLPKGKLEVWANHRAYSKNLDFVVDFG